MRRPYRRKKTADSLPVPAKRRTAAKPPHRGQPIHPIEIEDTGQYARRVQTVDVPRGKYTVTLHYVVFRYAAWVRLIDAEEIYTGDPNVLAEYVEALDPDRKRKFKGVEKDGWFLSTEAMYGIALFDSGTGNPSPLHFFLDSVYPSLALATGKVKADVISQPDVESPFWAGNDEPEWRQVFSACHHQTNLPIRVFYRDRGMPLMVPNEDLAAGLRLIGQEHKFINRKITTWIPLEEKHLFPCMRLRHAIKLLESVPATWRGYPWVKWAALRLAEFDREVVERRAAKDAERKQASGALPVARERPAE